MAKYQCIRSCTLSGGRAYTKGSVYEFAADPGLYFETFTGQRLGAKRPEHLVDQDDGTYYYGGSGWDDLRFPFTANNPPGQVSPPDFDPVDGLPLFDAASTERIVGLAQMPHAWLEGSEMRPHIHWSPTSAGAGNVLWRLDYKIAGVGDSFPALWTTVDILAAADGDDKHQVDSFGQIDMTGETLSTVMKWRVSRIGGDGTDTYGADAKGIEFDIHYRMNSLGSGLEFEK
jgi:hypothetical protein